ncbi:MAG: fibronectin type III domain-containing protein [Lewinellaceae bacterium]|nr:fibronectin type III domain-containing protein [Lewinellaceae bacterium]
MSGTNLMLVQCLTALLFPVVLQGQTQASCPMPVWLNVSNIESTSATLLWYGDPAHESWEIEFLPEAGTFIGEPNYFSDQPSLEVTSILPGDRYKFRVRARCSGAEYSVWSNERSFITIPDCETAPEISCGEEIKLYLQPGDGYWKGLLGCGDNLTGDEALLQFNISDSNTTRYLYLSNKNWTNPIIGFYLKKADNIACNTNSGWQCLATTLNSTLITLTNLEPGATYYLMSKKRYKAGLDSVQIQLHCTLPCIFPTKLETQIIDKSTVFVNWNDNLGPWKYDVAILYEDGTEQVKSDVTGWPFGLNLGSWFTLNQNEMHAWRIRTICATGDTSVWQPYQYFRLPQRCEDLSLIDCAIKKSINLNQPENFYFKDYCTGNTSYGQQYVEMIRVWLNGTYSMRVNAGSQTVRYTLGRIEDSNCEWPDLTICDTITGIDTIDFGYLTAGKYILQIASSDTTSQLIELACACSKPNTGSGTLFANGSAYLSWLGGATNAQNWEIEVVPTGGDFSGTPTYYDVQNPYTVTGLDPSDSYKFRVRANCGAGVTGIWSAEYPITLITDCTSIPDLNCGETTILDFPNGSGLFDYSPCGVTTNGHEFFFRITPQFTGLYRLVVQETQGNFPKVSFGILDECDNPDGTISCVGRGGVATHWLGYLRAGKSYIVVADSETSYGPTYKISIDCWPPSNDGPVIFFFPMLPLPDIYIVEVGDTCEIFTNRLATQVSNAPDLSKSPSNWKDGLEHDVWFEFTAPPSGTVQINVKSDPNDPMDPQVALMKLTIDTMVGVLYKVLATGEDNAGPLPHDAVLVYTGLVPGERYHVVVDGADNSVGRFCLQILDEPEKLADYAGCQVSQTNAATYWTPGAWKNLYAESSQHVTGLLLGAIKSQNNLGKITISNEILTVAPVLSNGQKFIPRYFNIETQYPLQQPATLRLFFNANDLNSFNSTPPVDSVDIFQLGLSHYDGTNEDCTPNNNSIVGSFIPVKLADAVQVGNNGLFYLEADFDHFSEFSAAIPLTVNNSFTSTLNTALLTYPNPVQHTLYVRFTHNARAALQLKLLNVYGNPVLEQFVEGRSEENNFQIPVANLLPGIYELVLQIDGVLIGRARVVKI